MGRGCCGILVVVFALSVALPATGAPGAVTGSRYIIVTDADSDPRLDPYAAVVDELTKMRKAELVLSLKEKELPDVFSALRERQPAFVAFVVHPELIEDNFVGQVFAGMAALDDDPFLDCAFGYITGGTAADALALVRSTAAAEAAPDSVPRKFTAVAHTFAQNDLYPFAVQEAKRHADYGYVTAMINPRDNSREWKGEADREIRKLEGSSLVFLAGHGMGDSSCGIPGRRFANVTLGSAIVVNGTCHSAVTVVRHDSKDRFWTIETKRIDPKNSVCLSFVKAGAIGQFASTASSSWMNVAFAVNEFFFKGRSLGEALQESMNAKIRAAGIERVDIIPFRDGARSPQALGEDRNPGGIQSLARVILVGDPAYRPFPTPPSRVGTRPPSVGKDELGPEDAHLRRLVAELSNPDAPHFKALNEIVALGSSAVPTLIVEMRRNDNWQVPKALGAIGDERAILPLIEKLEQSDWSPMREVVAEALTRITGKELGKGARAWRSWWETEGHKRQSIQDQR